MLGILRSEYILREYILVSKNNLERKQLAYYYYVECDRGYSVMVGHQKWPNKEEKLQRETIESRKNDKPITWIYPIY